MTGHKRKNSLWDDDPEGYAALRRDWLNTRREFFLEPFVEKLAPGSRILEIGSGTGLLLCSLAAKFPLLEFVGTEVLETYVEYSRKLAAEASLTNVKFIESAAEKLSSTDSYFSLILSNDMLHHVDNLPEVAKECFRVAMLDTVWIAIEPNCLNPYTLTKQSILPGEKNFFPGRFSTHASNQGWREVRRNYLFLVPPCIAAPPSWMINLERKLEWIPFLAGGVALELRKSIP